MVVVPRCVSLVVRRAAIDAAGRVASRDIVAHRDTWGVGEKGFDEDLIVFPAGMGGDEIDRMRRLEDQLGVVLMRQREGSSDWECVDGVLIGHLTGPYVCCPWLVEGDINREYVLRLVGYPERFLAPQAVAYSEALEEVRAGRKRGHWIWYIFPQLRGLGHSLNSDFYGLVGLVEARAYWAHPVLRERLHEITRALLAHAGTKSAEDIFGSLDALKVRSCLTLFEQVAAEDVFGPTLEAFYGGQRDPLTLELLRKGGWKIKVYR